jgi:hypothetical protein
MTAIPTALAGSFVSRLANRPDGIRSRIRDRRRDLNPLAYENIINLVLSLFATVKSDCAVSLSLSLSLSQRPSRSASLETVDLSAFFTEKLCDSSREPASGSVASRFHLAWISDGQASNSHNRVHIIEESRVVAHAAVRIRRFAGLANKSARRP